MSRKKTLLISLGILIAAAVVTMFIFMTEPTASSEGATKQTAMLVETVPAEKGTFSPKIVVNGNVEPVEDIMLSPLVGGQVLRRSPAFVPGGFVEKGTVLLQIDPADYRNVLELRRSALLQAQTDLDVEMGRQQVAEQDLALVGGDTLSAEQRSLVLRQPQLNAVRANIKAAQAAVSQAELDLARTTIRAPFDAHILSQKVTAGSQVAPGDDLGRLVGTEFYWVSLTVPVGHLRWLSFPASEEEKGSPVEIINTSAWPQGSFRRGYLAKQVGALDGQTRLARVLVEVPDPLARTPENEGKPELMIGAFVEAGIEAEPIENVIRLNRDFVRTNQTVWVNDDGKLVIRKVDILLTDAKYAYITKGLAENEQVVTTNLSAVAEGLGLRTKTEKPAQDTDSVQTDTED
ncbi:efflux RND transporter periplasmic adaptor subunit [Salinimicrobium sp. CDJ15-81-2]|nr:efflux RND transporter periplasmic adaptor subunit [Salinimicrobium nanhaiense]